MIGSNTEVYKKNISDIDKILGIFDKNKGIKDNKIYKQLKAKRNSNVIKLFEANTNIMLHNDSVNNIRKIIIDTDNQSVKIICELIDGSIYEGIYPIGEVVWLKRNKDYNV